MNDDTDKILQAEMSDEETIVSLARLCRHRGQCMDDDAKKITGLTDVIETYREAIGIHKQLGKTYESKLEMLEYEARLLKRLKTPALHRVMVWINAWAKS